ncbi:bladder cancer-associated protein isoform X2 [Erinaceus europaeus]|uniref:Bladder cancer-associated protein isoform X2 n=1 Tax=Erinaceus europaeus TaxID=9365 RepID=A0A1S3W6Q2_ERIEU|nr:bladder cancer-associated protein isoform X2 [Erinaceus europaeus]
MPEGVLGTTHLEDEGGVSPASCGVGGELRWCLVAAAKATVTAAPWLGLQCHVTAPLCPCQRPGSPGRLRGRVCGFLPSPSGRQGSMLPW